MAATLASLAIRAPAKLNLFLHVTGRRADGYHLLQSLFVMIDRCDTLEVAVRGDGLITRARDVPGVPAEQDLAVRAARALKARTGTALGADLAVTKSIPMGGGLGGGSSDAAAVLMALDRAWGTRVPADELARLGLALGADVPFFLGGGSAFAEGVGEVLTPVEVPGWWYVVLTPPEAVATPAVFAHPDLTRDTPPLKIADFSARSLVFALQSARNDLQAVVVKQFPVVAAHLEALAAVSQKSLFGARMTGSGACVFAAFESPQDAVEAFQALPSKYPGFVAQGLPKHPFRDT